MAYEFGRDLQSTFTLNYNKTVHNAYVLGVKGLTQSSFSPSYWYLPDDISYGGTFTNDGIFDAEKSYKNQDDDDLCWAAADSNMLAWTGWGEMGLNLKGVNPEDTIFAHYISSFKNEGFSPFSGLTWFFEPFTDNIIKKADAGNFFGISPQMDYARSIENLEQAIKEKRGVAIGYVTDTTGTAAHAVTVFGYSTDSAKKPGDKGYYTGLFITDSDDNKEYDKRGEQPVDQLRYVPLQYDAAENVYRVVQCFRTSYTSYEIHYSPIISYTSVQRYEPHKATVAKNERITAEVVYNGKQNVYGVAVSTHILKNGVQTIYSDARASDCYVAKNGTQIVHAGATTINTHIREQGCQKIYGIATSSLVSSGGSALVGSGGYAGYFNVLSGGIISLAKSSLAEMMFVSSGGIVNMNAGASALGLNFGAPSDYGEINVGSNVADRFYVGKSATLTVEAAQKALTPLVEGNLLVCSGGYVSTVSAVSGAVLTVEAGAVVEDLNLQSGGKLNMNAGAIANGWNSGAPSAYGKINVASNVADRFYVGKSATLTVAAGQISISAFVAGKMVVEGGTDKNAIIESGIQEIMATGISSDAQIFDGGVQIVSSGGSAVNITVYTGGIQSALSGAWVKGGTVKSGGSHYAANGAFVSGLVVDAKAIITSDGGTTRPVTSSSITSSGGSSSISSSGGSSSVASSGGTSSSTMAIVDKGATAYDTLLKGKGEQKVQAGGKAIRTEISASARQYVYGVASATTVKKGGTQIIYKNGSGIRDIVYGFQTISTGGKATSASIKSGGAQYLKGGVASGAIISRGGEQHIYAGARASGGIIYGGGRQYIYDKGTVSNIKIAAGASQILRGGSLRVTTYSSGATLLVSRGTASSITLVNGGNAIISKGGILRTATVGAKSLLGVNAGAILSQITVASKATLKTSGAVSMYGVNTVIAATGAGVIKLARGASLNLDQQAAFQNMTISAGSGQVQARGIGNVIKSLVSEKDTILGFDIGKVDAASRTAMLTIQNRQSLKGVLSLSVLKSQKLGLYELASKLALAKNTAFTVKVAGAKVGLVKLNGAILSNNGVQYSLKTSGSQLNLKLAAIAGKMLKGTAKNETLAGGANCDIFYGGAGNDTISGVNGRDVVVYDKKAWGNDIIASTGGTITLMFTGIAKARISQKSVGKDMIFTCKDLKNQRITVKNWNSATHNVIYGGSLGQYSKYLATARPNTSLQNSARNEIWKKTGLLA